MREIKFRAWHEKEEVWYYFDLSQLMVGSQELAKECLRLVHRSQYTGLKDKNGNDIYEGDILADNTWGDRTVRGVMAWDEGTSGWGQFHPILNFEVIGNIYRNPELAESAA